MFSFDVEGFVVPVEKYDFDDCLGSSCWYFVLPIGLLSDVGLRSSGLDVESDPCETVEKLSTNNKFMKI